MKRLRTPIGLLASAVLGATIALSPAAAQAGVSIQIEAALPGLFLPMPTPPAMVWLPGVNFYVARDSSRPFFYREGRYYMRHDNRWYSSTYYGGPWSAMPYRALPMPLRRFRDADWQRYRHDADERFRDDRGPDGPAPFYPRFRDHGRYRGPEGRPEDRRGPDRFRGRGPDRGGYGRGDRGGDFRGGDFRDHGDHGDH